MDFEKKYLKYKTKYLNLKSNSMVGGAKRKIKRVAGNNGKLFIIGIAGASGCGKTYLANKLKKALMSSGVNDVQILSCDNYYIPSQGPGRHPEGYNFDLPETINLDGVGKDLERLKNKEEIKVPKYDFEKSKVVGISNIIDGSKVNVLIVEGLYTLYNEKIRNNLDLKIFTILDPELCLARRLLRDVSERNTSFQDTLKLYENQVKPAYMAYAEPTKKFADMMVSTDKAEMETTISIIETYVLDKLNIKKKREESSDNDSE